MLCNSAKDVTIKKQIMRKDNKNSKNDQAYLEELRGQILGMIDKLSAADCAEVFSKLKERGVL